MVLQDQPTVNGVHIASLVLIICIMTCAERECNLNMHFVTVRVMKNRSKLISEQNLLICVVLRSFEKICLILA